MAARGHQYCGRELFGFLRAVGLTEVRAEGRLPLLYAGTVALEWKRLSVEQLRGEIVRAGSATESEIEAYFALLKSRDFVAQGFLVMTACGRRPWSTGVGDPAELPAPSLGCRHRSLPVHIVGMSCAVRDARRAPSLPPATRRHKCRT